ncbi:uncharacterized protein B0T15DRAFT_388131, partial [Chaetomium strumarium]
LATLVPFVSPLLGLGTQKTKFLVKLRDKYSLPIYTLCIPGSHIYVITSLSLVLALQC